MESSPISHGQAEEQRMAPTSAAVLNVRLEGDADDLEARSRLTRYTGVNPPIALTTNYHWPTRQDEMEGNYFYYSRSDNPNYILLEKELTRLHHGSSAVVFASGMAAISAVLLSLVKKDKSLVRASEVYNDVPKLLQEMQEMSGTHAHVVDICDTDAVIEKVAQENVRMLYMETASNPNNRVPDFDDLIRRTREVNPQCLVVVDNTFLSPIHFRPLDHGADIVIESGTKYLSGKGDVLLGAVVFRKKKDQGDVVLTAITQRVLRWRSIGGGSPSPMSCWLVSKGLETLRLRMHHATATALEVARFLETVPCVTRVVFPGLASHPCHERAVKYFGARNSGAVIRFHIPMLGPTVSKMLADPPHPFIHAVSLGEAHTLLYPVPGESRIFPEDAERNAPDYVGYWFRVAIGLETPDEIISGFLRMFAQEEELVMKVGEIKKFDAKTRQLSFSGKQASSSPFLFFFQAHASDDAKGKSKQAASKGTGQVIFIERLADEGAGSKEAKKGKATVTLGLGSAGEEKALLTKGTCLFAFKPALTIHTQLTQ